MINGNLFDVNNKYMYIIHFRNKFRIFKALLELYKGEFCNTDKKYSISIESIVTLNF